MILTPAASNSVLLSRRAPSRSFRCPTSSRGRRRRGSALRRPGRGARRPPGARATPERLESGRRPEARRGPYSGQHQPSILGNAPAPVPPGSNWTARLELALIFSTSVERMKSHWSALSHPSTSQRPSGDQATPLKIPCPRRSALASQQVRVDDQELLRAARLRTSAIRLSLGGRRRPRTSRARGVAGAAGRGVIDLRRTGSARVARPRADASRRPTTRGVRAWPVRRQSRRSVGVGRITVSTPSAVTYASTVFIRRVARPLHGGCRVDPPVARLVTDLAEVRPAQVRDSESARRPAAS